MSVIIQTYGVFRFGHRLYNRVFYEVSIQLAVKKDILNGTRYVVILGTFYNSILIISMATVVRVAENDIPIELVSINLCAYVHRVSNPFTNTNPITLYASVLTEQPFFAIGCINETIDYLPLASA